MATHQRVEDVPDGVDAPARDVGPAHRSLWHGEPPADQEEDGHHVVECLVGEELPALRIPNMPEQEGVGDDAAANSPAVGDGHAQQQVEL
jgi:hypothetical protein